ncbi:PepSY domain-containing protein [Pseudalkalibacillus salsuginis]|uniref:PepSY domain-containing protein n=1 Tax=Pseudalkalibacillus salsuginis TaxID=2910972 RepID=UPI001F37B72E|nr:PepSY domain-containing protein [Pseudalkalibacillus salsuginis]MCF6411348.1 PepSY domain-containing protein [Pseudalkalibacillus salsuginis]
MKRNVFIIVGVALFVVSIIITTQHILASQNDRPLAESEIKEFIASKYAGEIQEVTARENLFEAILERDTGTYKIVINSDERSIEKLEVLELREKRIDEKKAKEIALKDVDGEVEEAQFLKSKNPPVYKIKVKTDKGVTVVTVDAKSGEIIDRNEEKTDEPKEQEKTLISEKEAKEKALSVVSGEIDDIELITINGIPTYEIEMESNDEEDVTVLVDGFTGESTITYED